MRLLRPGTRDPARASPRGASSGLSSVCVGGPGEGRRGEGSGWWGWGEQSIRAGAHKASLALLLRAVEGPRHNFKLVLNDGIT